MVVFAIASFACTIPHFIYGDQLLSSHMKLSGGGKSQVSTANMSGSSASLFRAWEDANRTLCYETGTNFDNGTNDECSSDLKGEQIIQSDVTSVVLAILAVSLLAIGVGQTAVSTLGIPYIDDNVASRESPIYIGECRRARACLTLKLTKAC